MVEATIIFDYTSNRIILNRSSCDFGKPKWHLLDVLKVPSVYRGLRLVYMYDDNFHDDFNLTTHLDEETVSELSCQFPFSCDYDGEGARETKFVFVA